MEHEDHDKPEYDMKMECLLPVLRGEIPLKFMQYEQMIYLLQLE